MLSSEVKSDNRDAPSYETNLLSVIAMRGIDRSHTSLSNLCGFMNLPSSMYTKTYNNMLEKIAPVYKEVANTSMNNAPNDFWFKQDDQNVEISGTFNENAIADITVHVIGIGKNEDFHPSMKL